MGNAISAAGNVATGDISGARTDLGETAASLGNIVGANYIPRDTPGVGFLGGGGRRRGVSDVGEFDRAISLLPDPVEPWVRAGVDIATDPVTYVSFGIGPTLKATSGAAKAAKVAGKAGARGGQKIGGETAVGVLTKASKKQVRRTRARAVQQRANDIAEQFDKIVRTQAREGKVAPGFQDAKAVKQTHLVARHTQALEDMPETFQYGVNLPRRLGGRRTLESEGLATFVSRMRGGARNQDQLKAINYTINPNRGMDPATAQIANSARQIAAAREAKATARIRSIEKEYRKRLAATGNRGKRQQINEQMVRKLDGRKDAALPEEFDDLYQAFRAEFDDIEDFEIALGIRRGSVGVVDEGSYVPYILRDRMQRDKLQVALRRANEPVDREVQPSMLAREEFNDIDEFAAFATKQGNAAEMDPVRLLQARQRQSAKVAEEQALRAAVGMLKGVKIGHREEMLQIAQHHQEKVNWLRKSLREVDNTEKPAIQQSIEIHERAVRNAKKLADETENVSKKPKREKYEDTYEDAQELIDLEQGMKPWDRAAKRNQAFVDEVIDSPNMYDPDVLQKLTDEFTTLMSRNLSPGGKGRVRLSNEDANFLQDAMAKLGNTSRNPEDMRMLRASMDEVMSRWKSLALLTPGYHLRNVFDDTSRAMLVGGARNPKSFHEAMRIMSRAWSQDDLLSAGNRQLAANGDRVLKFGDWEGTVDEFIRLADTLGVTRGGMVGVELSPRGITGKVADTRMQRLFGRGPGRGVVTQQMQRVGQAREDITRMGLFIERLKKGDDFFQAAKTTQKTLFDYGDVSVLVERARSFWAPFLTYTSKVIPQTINLFARRPGVPIGLSRLQQASNEAAGYNRYSQPAFFDITSFRIPLSAKYFGGPDTASTVTPYNFFGPAGVIRSGASFAQTLRSPFTAERPDPEFVTELLGPGPTYIAGRAGIDTFRNRFISSGDKRKLFGVEVNPAVEQTARLLPGTTQSEMLATPYRKSVREDQGFARPLRYFGIPVRVDKPGEETVRAYEKSKEPTADWSRDDWQYYLRTGKQP